MKGHMDIQNGDRFKTRSQGSKGSLLAWPTT